MVKLFVLLINIFIQCCFGGDSTYHVSFLGRTNFVRGIGMFQTLDDKLDITSASSTCTDDILTMPAEFGIMLNGLTNPDCFNLAPNGTELAAKGFAVTVPDDSALHVIQTNDYGGFSDGFMAIPDDQLGTEYIVVTYCTVGGLCQVSITATQDNTFITVIFPETMHKVTSCESGMLMSHKVQSGSALPYIIHEYDTIHFESEQDLSGTYMKSSHVISVIVGARDLPTADGQTTASAMEQIIPLNKWGTEFIVALNLNHAGDIIKIVSKVDSTVVHIQGFSPFMMRYAGDAVERRLDWKLYTRIQTSNPVMVMQVLSVHLYNSAANVIGTPSMVLVPHTGQLVVNKVDVYYHCPNEGGTSNLISVLVATSGWVKVKEPSEYIMTPDDVPGTDFKVYTLWTDLQNVHLEGEDFIGYGSCQGVSSFLLASDWSAENEECVLTTPVPGDNVDNDCNGQIDEVQCTEADLDINFNAVQNMDGSVTYKTIVVRGTSKVRFTVKSCDIAMVVFRTSDGKSLIISIESERISFSFCQLTNDTNINDNTNTYKPCTILKTVDDNNLCTGTKEYELNWESSITLTYGQTSFPLPVLPVEFNEMIVSTFLGMATYKIFQPEKDCGKVYRGDGVADMNGVEFFIPVSSSDSGYSIYLTNNGQNVAEFSMKQTHSIAQTSIRPGITTLIVKTDITESIYTGLNLFVHQGELLVYVIREQLTDIRSGFSVIPLDVLGPNYHLIHQGFASTGSCDIFALNEATKLGNGEILQKGSLFPVPFITNSENQRLLPANRPVVVFCGLGGNYAQMPPTETLGLKHYIPPINFAVTNISRAVIYITATDDGTVVLIKGDYDNMDVVQLSGDSFHRKMETNVLYNITASKPIQVLIELQYQIYPGPLSSSLVVVPPIQHYTSESKMVDYFPSTSTLAYQVGVNINGDVYKTVTPGSLSFETFIMSFVMNEASIFVFTNNRNYTDINKICEITPSMAGDKEDNDCDNLVDEEECIDELIPGYIDDDIDGVINGDCSQSTSVPSRTNIELQGIYYYKTQCYTDGASTPPNVNDISVEAGSDTGITVGGTIAGEIDFGNITFPVNNYENIQPFLTEPSSPFTCFNPNINSSSSSSSTNTTTESEKTCLTFCPCYWMKSPQNYTEKEIQEQVRKLIEKLTIDKTQLSATKRKKISAKDGRRQAKGVGIVAIIWMSIMFGALIVMDIPLLIRDFKAFVRNLRNLFNN